MTGASNPNKRILIVEDEPVIRQVLGETLSREGFEVELAAHGREAMPKLAASHYELFIIDLKTPVMSGREFYQYILDNYPEITGRVLFTSDDILSYDTETFLTKSGRMFLAKPFTPDEAVAMVNQALRTTDT